MSMSKRKGGWERAQEAKKKKQMEEDLLAKTHKLTSYFQVVDKDVGSSSGDHDDQSRPICPPSDTVQSKVIGDDDKESTATKVQSSVSNEAVPNDVGLFGNITENLREVCISMGTDHFRNLANDYPKTKREYSGVNRFLNPSAFTRVLPNGEVVSRDWLVYSPAKTCVFCFPCILFSSDRSIKLCTSGDNDWKNITQNLKSHETSTKHIDSVLTLAHRSAAVGRIDAELHKNMIEQHKYWKNVLTRCVATIAFLCERGLPLRGSNEIIGSSNNGNYLGILELISQFDPFLSQHIRQHANRGRGHASYLSKTICEELVTLMGHKVLDAIKQEILKSRYFSISVDSTPDITHTDQLTIIIRHVNMKKYEPVERFLTFIPISSHTGQNLADTLLQYLSEQNIDFTHCRGQTYDNASNMSGKYIGMQQILKNKNSLVDYIPCAGHSLNLVGQSAVDCCVEAVSYFGFLQRLYTFFVASTHRWRILLIHIEQKPHCLIPKHLSDTRWSARADATEAVFQGYQQFHSALEEIAADDSQNRDTRNQANALAKHMDTIEVSFMCELWNDILQRFNQCSKLLQSATIELTTAIGLLKSLAQFISDCREKFDIYEQKASDRCGNSSYKYESETRRIPKRKKHVSEGSASDAMESMTGKQKFKVNTFNVIIDQLNSALKKRIEAYSTMQQRFGVLTEFESMSDDDIVAAIERLVGVYAGDLSSDFYSEFCQFICWYKEQTKKICSKEASTGIAQHMFKLMHKTGISTAFPNTEVALRIYLSLMATNCSGERSFSQLTRIKDVKRSTMSQHRLGVLALLCIEKDLLSETDFSSMIDEFATVKARKVKI